EQEYPFSYLIPNGNVFTIGPSEDVSFELNVQNQTWTPVGGASGVTNGSSVMYRPGKILYSGGTDTQESNSPAHASTAVIHSTAILMPDGTVLIGGSGHANPGLAAQTTSQIYSPPYLFKGARPTISSAPAAASYGSAIPVSTPDAASIRAVNLVSLGSDTHQ